jgi:hypothetical protein
MIAVALSAMSGCAFGDDGTPAAREDALGKANQVGRELSRSEAWTAADLGYMAAHSPGVELMAVRGTDKYHDPVVLIIRVSGSGYPSGDANPVTVAACFSMGFANGANDGAAGETDCPETQPITR